MSVLGHRYMQIHMFSILTRALWLFPCTFCGGHDRSTIRYCGGLQISGPSLVLDISPADVRQERRTRLQKRLIKYLANWQPRKHNGLMHCTENRMAPEWRPQNEGEERAASRFTKVYVIRIGCSSLGNITLCNSHGGLSFSKPKPK